MKDHAELVAGLRSGKKDAFDAAYRRYRARIYSFLVRLSRNDSIAEDLLQDTFVRLAKHSPRLAEDTRLDAWLFTVARNLYVSHRPSE